MIGKNHALGESEGAAREARGAQVFTTFGAAGAFGLRTTWIPRGMAEIGFQSRPRGGRSRVPGMRVFFAF